jgi:hypothetical protein
VTKFERLHEPLNGLTVLATSLAIQSVLAGAGLSPDLLGVIVGGLLIVYAMWWICFEPMSMTRATHASPNPNRSRTGGFAHIRYRTCLGRSPVPGGGPFRRATSAQSRAGTPLASIPTSSTVAQAILDKLGR